MVKNGIYSSFWVLGIKLYPEAYLERLIWEMDE
jgi:hypothetical protein